MNRQHAIDRVVAMALEPWAITPPMLRMVASILARRMAGVEAQDLEYVTRPITGPTGATPGGVAVIPVHGVIAPRMNLMSDISGGATFEESTSLVREAVASPGVGTIVLDIDSPGGSVAGATEFAREVLKARTVKPVIAVANYACCSAAYWFGACATELVAAPSAMVGSIGVYTIHEDLSKALDELGIKITYVSAGKFKVDGNETEPLSDTARARMTEIVNRSYTRFVGDVALGRGVSESAIRTGYGEGAVLTAEEALAIKMVDRIATLDETIARVLDSPPKLGSRASTDPPDPSAASPALPASQQATTDQERTRQRREVESAGYALDFM